MIRKLEAIAEPLRKPDMSAGCGAVSIIIEVGDETRTVHLMEPITIADIWHFFTTRYRKPDMVALSGGVARVTFHYRKGDCREALQAN